MINNDDIFDSDDLEINFMQRFKDFWGYDFDIPFKEIFNVLKEDDENV